MFSIFKKPDPIMHDQLGELSYRESEWIGKLHLPNGVAELVIAGDKKGPDSFALEFAAEIHSSISNMWLDAVEFALQEIDEKTREKIIGNSDFVLRTVAIHKQFSFDGGHLSFWFNVRPDKNGSYYVSFRDGSPFLCHRDS